jgi:predicted amidohydrolase YtcJ
MLVAGQASRDQGAQACRFGRGKKAAFPATYRTCQKARFSLLCSSEAMRICTLHGAYPSFGEILRGSLTLGKLADFMILEEDQYDVDPDSIIELKVVHPVLAGTTTHEA